MPKPSTFSASLRIYKDNLDPHAITTALEIEPSAIFPSRSSKYCQSKNLHTPKRRGGWILSSPELAADGEPARGLLWILDRIQQKTNAIRNLISDGADVDIYCTMTATDYSVGFSLPADLLLRVSDLGVEVGIEVFFEPDDSVD